MTTAIAIIVAVIFLFSFAKKLLTPGTKAGATGVLSPDGNRLQIGKVIFEYFPETAKLKVSDDTGEAFNDYPHRLYLKPNFSTKDTIYQETFTGTDNKGNFFQGLGGFKSGKAIDGKWFELQLNRKQGTQMEQVDLNCFVDRSEGREKQIYHFVTGQGRGELGRTKAKSLGEPMYATVDFSDTFGGFD